MPGMPARLAENPAPAPELSTVVGVWRDVLLIARRRPGVLLPFAVLAALEAYCLVIIVAPPGALRGWLDSFIARQYGSPYVPYPFRNVVLPALFSGARILLEIAVGSLMSAWLTARVIFLLMGESIGLGGAFRAGASRYVAFVLLGFLSLALSHLTGFAMTLIFSLTRHGRPVFPAPEGLYLLVAATFVVITLIQSLLVYAPAAVIAENRPLLRALGRSAATALRRPFLTILLVALPVLPFFLLSFAASMAPARLGVSAPVPDILAAGIVAGYLARFFVIAGSARAYSTGALL
jgi:hypothetical protein